MNVKRQIAAVLVLVVFLLISGCETIQPIEPTVTQTPTPAPTPTLTPTPANTPAPTPELKTLTLKATGDLLKLLDRWDDKYAVFINIDTDIEALEDLNGKKIYCDMYTFGLETAVNDMSAFNTAAGVEMEIGLGNNIDQFFDQLAGDKNKLGFLPKTVADSNSVQNDPNLMIVVFE